MQALVVGPPGLVEPMPFRQTPAPEKNDDGFILSGHSTFFVPSGHITLLSDWLKTAIC